MNFIGKILPIDGYYVMKKEHLPVDYAVSLTHLYQPLIGIYAVSLYHTLLHDSSIHAGGSPQTHHTLMNYLNLSLDEIYRSRLKLEGIGLLKTYKNKEENRDFYTYELLRPYAPTDFFKDDMLSQLLLHHIGDQKFDMLFSHYVPKNLEYGENITVDFSDVFQTVTPTEKVANVENYNYQHNSVNYEVPMDFSWIEQMLHKRMIPVNQVLTMDTKRLIYQMKVLYNLDSHEIERACQYAINEDYQFNQKEFKAACHDIFRSNNNQQSVRLSEKNNQEVKKYEVTKPKTKKEQLIYELERISPTQLLKDLSRGNDASDQDIKVIETVMTKQDLPAPVMNVLIHYVLLQSNMKLSKAYLEKIASHWSRLNLQTASDAMNFARQEQQNVQSKVKKNNYTRRQNTTKEVIPDWFKERKNKSQVTSEKPDTSMEDQEKIASRLKQYLNEN
ncbi:replication initiation and membrane attachment family protein [Oceanobacillus iheyensis]|uniref:Chromosome replication initiation: membrane attachment protein n=1 Tax=Oceanobacillus iheyensis (strain DSM 14371 / CIP 107618 / JCM 11309 / KCTC 3954 / HTE831) TaxID=221109 RepID=Q8EPF1_OCEIH|nr:DnaD domain protein [Oceanobacillus iheyensis]BAC14113.1 chromosome replication initiation : membrane attachment protein [Oceanobacillus iheyensis HTE831]